MKEVGAVKPNGPELIFGLVGPLGTDLDLVGRVLQDVLSQVEYKSEVYRLSRLMRDVPKEPWSLLKDGAFDEMVDSHMTAGNKFCEVLQRNDAVVLLGIGAMADTRDALVGDANVSIPRFAHILRSLKRPTEVETLRKIYGPTFFLVGAHAPRAKRLQNVATKIAESHFSNKISEHIIEAERLLKRDEAEPGDSGQNVRDTFPLADVIVDSTQETKMTESLSRFIELLFGNTYTCKRRTRHVLRQWSSISLCFPGSASRRSVVSRRWYSHRIRGQRSTEV